MLLKIKDSSGPLHQRYVPSRPPVPSALHHQPCSPPLGWAMAVGTMKKIPLADSWDPCQAHVTQRVQAAVRQNQARHARAHALLCLHTYACQTGPLSSLAGYCLSVPTPNIIQMPASKPGLVRFGLSLWTSVCLWLLLLNIPQARSSLCGSSLLLHPLLVHIFTHLSASHT